MKQQVRGHPGLPDKDLLQHPLGPWGHRTRGRPSRRRGSPPRRSHLSRPGSGSLTGRLCALTICLVERGDASTPQEPLLFPVRGVRKEVTVLPAVGGSDGYVVFGIPSGSLTAHAVPVAVHGGRELATILRAYPRAVIERQSAGAGRPKPPGRALRYPEGGARYCGTFLPAVLAAAGVEPAPTSSASPQASPSEWSCRWLPRGAPLAAARGGRARLPPAADLVPGRGPIAGPARLRRHKGLLDLPVPRGRAPLSLRPRAVLHRFRLQRPGPVAAVDWPGRIGRRHGDPGQHRPTGGQRGGPALHPRA